MTVNIELRLRELIRALREVEVLDHREKIEATLNWAEDYIDHNEVGVAFELLCDNLYEWDYPLPQGILLSFQEIGPILTPDDRRVTMLEELIVTVKHLPSNMPQPQSKSWHEKGVTQQPDSQEAEPS